MLIVLETVPNMLLLTLNYICKKEQRGQRSQRVVRKKYLKLSFILFQSTKTRNLSAQNLDDSSAQSSSWKPKNLPVYHAEETRETAQNKPLVQGKFVVDNNLVSHISTPMRLTIHNCLLKTGMEDKSTWQPLNQPRNFGNISLGPMYKMPTVFTLPYPFQWKSHRSGLRQGAMFCKEA